MGLAMHTTWLLTQRYIKNDDASVVNMRRYDEDSAAKYPTFSFCFKGSAFHWYNSLPIFAAYGLSASQYELMLKGEKAMRYKRNTEFRSYNKTTVFLQDGYGSDFELFHLDVSDLFTTTEFQVEYQQPVTNSSQKNLGILRKNPQLHLSYQSSDTICFTRNDDNEERTIRLYDLVTFNEPIIGKDIYGDTEIRIFVHHTGQLMKSFDDPRYTGKLSNFYANLVKSGNGEPKIMEFQVSQAKIMKKRDSKNTPCDSAIEDYQGYLKRQIVKKVGCVPIYWNDIFENNTAMEGCTSPEKLKEVRKYIDEYKEIIKENEKPCETLLVSATNKIVEDRIPSPKGISVGFAYVEKYYMEIEYIQAFNVESFGSGLGGFIGIFLGWSMMNIPGFLQYISDFFRKGR